MGRHACGLLKTIELITVDIEPRIIKTDKQYRAYLADVERLAADDPSLDTPDGDRLELLAKLVEDYEKERFKFERPDPIEAILFRMEEQGLRRKDLAPILGGKNRVSEILSRKRPLTLTMVRALTESLRIPAELLIREPESQQYREEHTITYGSTPETNKTNLRLWVGKVRELAQETHRERGAWRADTLNEQFLSYVAKLSWSESGPRRAKEFLAEKGIALVVLPALPRTRLDGAAILGEDGAPIVGLTFRHDRIDSFWFTLVHELAHAWKHLSEIKLAITDENVEDEHDDDTKEVEANRLARDAFIPRSVWKRSEAFLHPSAETVQVLADKLHISPAVIAGRLRREKVGYAGLSRLVGYRQVRRLFPEVKWG